MIAIVASPRDLHARAVAVELERMGQRVRFIDTRQFGQGALISLPIGGEPSITPVGDPAVQMADAHTVWYRRPRPPQIAAGVRAPEDRRFCRQEWATTFDGLLLGLDARFVNPVLAEFSAAKPRQLAAAAHAGMRIPDTLVTNDSAAVESFVERHAGQVIHKALTAPTHCLLTTRRWEERDRSCFDDLPVAPTMFQELIAGPYDIRATVVGTEILAARISTAEGRAGIDSRMDLDAPYAAHVLPAAVHRALLALMSELGLLYGTVDLKVTDDGEHVFFEVNPQGQFLCVELLTGLPIARAVAGLLADPSIRGRPLRVERDPAVLP